MEEAEELFFIPNGVRDPYSENTSEISEIKTEKSLNLTKMIGIPRFASGFQKLHAVVIRTAAALWRDPGDDLVRIGDIAGFAVNAVGWIQVDHFTLGR